jgi:hypothetical protein
MLAAVFGLGFVLGRRRGSRRIVGQLPRRPRNDAASLRKALTGRGTVRRKGVSL